MTNYDRLKEYEEHKEPLPSYEEYQRLKALSEMFDITSEELSKMIKANNFLAMQVQIAEEALKEYSKTPTRDWIDSTIVAKRALKEMEGVK